MIIGIIFLTLRFHCSWDNLHESDYHSSRFIFLVVSISTLLLVGAYLAAFTLIEKNRVRDIKIVRIITTIEFCGVVPEILNQHSNNLESIYNLLLSLIAALLIILVQVLLKKQLQVRVSNR